jgi:hypothetical protein
VSSTAAGASATGAGMTGDGPSTVATAAQAIMQSIVALSALLWWGDGMSWQWLVMAIGASWVVAIA